MPNTAPGPHQPLTIPTSPGGREVILIVEDSPTQLEFLRGSIQQHGLTAEVATNGAEALARLVEIRPALLITDVMMPGMDGYELCRRVKADPAYRHIPVILLTGLNDPKDVIRGLECGADMFVVKPYDQGYLLSRVADMLANRQVLETKRPEPVEITYAGEPYLVKSSRRQMLNLLLSTYEAAIRKNSELLKAQQDLRAANAELEGKVRERTARLEQANTSLESFSYTIAHDLRAPLRAIQGFTTLLLKEYGHSYDEVGRDYADRVIRSAVQMDQLIQDLLAFGRITQADFPLSNLSLESVVDLVIQQLGPEIAANHAQVRVDRPMPMIRANATILDQVITNLLSNALKFVAEGVTPAIRIWTERSGTTVRLLIQDNGIGIEPQFHDRIFGMFERLHDSKKYPGTGIGLMIVRKGIERMGGRVGLHSTPGQGSCFWMELGRAD